MWRRRPQRILRECSKCRPARIHLPDAFSAACESSSARPAPSCCRSGSPLSTLKEIVRAIAVAAQRACKGTQSRDGFHHAVLQRGIEAHRVHSGSWQPESIQPAVRGLFSDCSNQFAVATMAALERRQGMQMVCAHASVFCPTAPHPWASSTRCRRPRCYSAWKIGSDSLLMKFGFSLALFRGENQHHAARPSAVGARA